MDGILGRMPMPELYWNNMITSKLCTRQAFVYSSMDALTDSTKVDEFIEERKKRGVAVRVLKFDDSDHVLHLRKYPREYNDLIDKVLKDCCEK